MPTARGFVKSYSNRLIGTFDIDCSPYHFFIEVDPLGQEFQCSNATLKYTNIINIIKRDTWKGTVSQTEFVMTRGVHASITGPLDTLRLLPVRIRGVGTWTTGAASSLDQPKSISLRAGEKALLESGAPIIVHVAVRAPL